MIRSKFICYLLLGLSTVKWATPTDSAQAQLANLQLRHLKAEAKASGGPAPAKGDDKEKSKKIEEQNKFREMLQDEIAKEVEAKVKMNMSGNKTREEVGKSWDDFYNHQAHAWSDYGGNWAQYRPGGAEDKQKNPQNPSPANAQPKEDYAKKYMDQYARNYMDQYMKQYVNQYVAKAAPQKKEDAKAPPKKKEAPPPKQKEQNVVSEQNAAKKNMDQNAKEDFAKKYMDQYAKQYMDQYAKKYMDQYAKEDYAKKYMDQYAKQYMDKYANKGDQAKKNMDQYPKQYMTQFAQQQSDQYVRDNAQQQNGQDAKQDYGKKYMDQYASQYMDQYVKGKYDEKSIRGQLSNIMEKYAKQDYTKQFWTDKNNAAQTKQSSASPSALTVNFDLKNNMITLKSDDDVDAKGQPIKVWQLNRETGDITITTRSEDGSELHVNHEKLGEAETDVTTDLEAEIEQQRSIAFKIMYFMIVFIIASLTLFYACQKNLNVVEGTGNSSLKKRADRAGYPNNMSSSYNLVNDLRKFESDRQKSGFGSNNLVHLQQARRCHYNNDIEVDGDEN